MIAGGSFSGMVEPSAGSEPLEKNAVSLERDIETSRFLRRETGLHTYFFSGSYCLRVLNRVSSIPPFASFSCHPDFSVDIDP